MLGALLLGAGCQPQGAPSESEKYPRPRFLTADTSTFTTRVNGYVLDPEAFFMSVAECGATCPLPPMLFDVSPLYLRSAVQNADVVAVDVATGQAQASSAVKTNAEGLWTMTSLPQREQGGYYTQAQGTGSLGSVPFPLTPTPIPATTYLPTLTIRRFTTSNPTCHGMEANLVGRNGILQAVARYLTSQGTATTPDDFINPARYAGVTVVWLGFPGYGYLRAPADGLRMSATAGQLIQVNWAPPGVGIPGQSARGFYVAGPSEASTMGIWVSLVPAGSAVSTVTLVATDPVVNNGLLRPWSFPNIEVTPRGGIITYVPLQATYSTGPSPDPINPTTCQL